MQPSAAHFGSMTAGASALEPSLCRGACSMAWRSVSACASSSPLTAALARASSLQLFGVARGRPGARAIWLGWCGGGVAHRRAGRFRWHRLERRTSHERHARPKHQSSRAHTGCRCLRQRHALARRVCAFCMVGRSVASIAPGQYREPVDLFASVGRNAPASCQPNPVCVASARQSMCRKPFMKNRAPLDDPECWAR